MTSYAPLDSDKISQGLKTRYIGSNILIYDSTASTNDVAKAYANDTANHGLAVFAEVQTQGRGRGKNTWISPKYESVLCSVLLTQCQIEPERLSLASAIATAEAISDHAQIKWPNDILLAGKKIAGILLESKQVKDHTIRIIGLGINCHQKVFPDEISNTATSLDLEKKRKTDRVTLARRLLTSIEHWLDIAEIDADRITSRFLELCSQYHQRISLHHHGRDYHGHCIGVDPKHGLIVKLDTGSTQIFSAFC